MASVDINIVGATAPFTFSVKDEFQIERFLSYSGGKIYFSDIQDNNDHTYTVTVVKGACTIVNQIILYNCGSSTPTPTELSQCIAPLISLVSIVNSTVTIGINTPTSNCTSYQIQYSTDINFSTINSITVSCNTQQYIQVPNLGVWYFRILKTCDNNATTYSNVITAQVTQTSPTPISTCTTCRYTNVYGAYSSWEVNYLDCDNIPRTAYGVSGGSTTICACQSSIETISGSVVLTDLGNCALPTPTPTPVPVPVSSTCKGLTFNIELSDLEAADGSVVFAQYTNCNGQTQNLNFINPGTYTGYCSEQTVNASVYIYIYGVQTEANSTFTVLSSC